MTKKEMQDVLKKNGTKLDGTETVGELKLLIASMPAESQPKVEKAKGDVFYVMLKTKAYVTDDQRLDAGFYKMSEIPKRLAKLSTKSMEVFTEAQAILRVTKIADWCGANIANIDNMDAVQALNNLVSEERYY